MKKRHSQLTVVHALAQALLLAACVTEVPTTTTPLAPGFSLSVAQFLPEEYEVSCPEFGGR